MKTDVANDHETVEGLVHIDGQPCYLVPDVHLMPPFLVAVVSPSDHWMYASSAGGVAAGRGRGAGFMQQAALAVGRFQFAAQFADARVLAGQRLLDHLGAVLRVVE